MLSKALIHTQYEYQGNMGEMAIGTVFKCVYIRIPLGSEYQISITRPRWFDYMLFRICFPYCVYDWLPIFIYNLDLF